MRNRILTLTLAVLASIGSGCTAGFRAGGERRSVGAGAAIGPAPAPVMTNAEAARFTIPPP